MFVCVARVWRSECLAIPPSRKRGGGVGVADVHPPKNLRFPGPRSNWRHSLG